MVTYTCNVTQAIRLEWTAVPFINNNNRLQFTSTTPPENRVLACGTSTSSVQCAEFDYRATLTRVGPVQNALADMTSTFSFTAHTRVNGTLVQCRESTATGIQTKNSTLIATGTTMFVEDHAVCCFIVKNGVATCSLSSHTQLSLS